MLKFNRVKASNPLEGRKGKKSRKSSKNPSVFGGGSGGIGIDVVPVLVGAAGAIAVSAFANSSDMFEKLRSGNPKVAAVLPAGVTFAAGWALAKYGKGDLMKKVGKNLQIFGAFGGVNALAGQAIREAVSKKSSAALPATAPANGLYFTRGDEADMSGTYFDRSDLGATLATF